MPRRSRKAADRRSPRGSSARPSRRVPDVEAVRRAVAGTLNREVEVEVEKQPDGRWAITMVVNGRRSPAIVVHRWEMEAIRQVPLVPAHLRGHFLRNYAVLCGARAPLDARAASAG